MKSISKMLIGLIVIALFNIAVVINANAGDYLGDFCWNFSITNNGSPVSGTIRLGINHIGGGHCTCSGIITVTTPASLQFTTFGNLELLSNEIRGTLTNQGKRFDNQGSYTVGIDMSTISLDPSTLNGSLEGFGIYTEKSELSKGTVTFTSCP
jgi:hypothetical protein